MYVCGDSFLTPSVKKPGTHMTELIANEIGYDLKVFARGGMSNGGICIQIESAIEAGADFIIFKPTSVDRIEMSAGKDERYDRFNVNDIWYNHPLSISTYDPELNKHPRLLIDNLRSLLIENSHTEYNQVINSMPERKKATQTYFKYLYNNNWKSRIDKWCLYAVLHKLETSGIPYLMVLDSLRIAKECPWLTEEKVALDYYQWWPAAEKKRNDRFIDPGYHTLEEDQIIGADIIINHIKQYNLLIT